MDASPRGLSLYWRIRERIRWWLYDRCLQFCVRQAGFVDAGSEDFMLLDTKYFVAVSRDTIKEIVEQYPHLGWRLGRDDLKEDHD